MTGTCSRIKFIELASTMNGRQSGCLIRACSLDLCGLMSFSRKHFVLIHSEWKRLAWLKACAVFLFCVSIFMRNTRSKACPWMKLHIGKIAVQHQIEGSANEVVPATGLKEAKVTGMRWGFTHKRVYKSGCPHSWCNFSVHPECSTDIINVDYEID